MHHLAKEFELHKMLSGKHIDKQLVMEIYDALECNNNMPKSWKDVKHTTFKKVFGTKPAQ